MLHCSYKEQLLLTIYCLPSWMTPRWDEFFRGIFLMIFHVQKCSSLRIPPLFFKFTIARFCYYMEFFVKLMAQISCLEHIRRGNLILKTILLSSERQRSQDGFVTFFTSCHSLVWHFVKTVGVWGYYCLVRNTSTKFNFQTKRLSWQKKVPFWYLRVLTKST